MTQKTVSRLNDLLPAQTDKYIGVNDAHLKLEGLSIPSTQSIVITAAPVTPNESITYICNGSIPGIPGTGASTFVRYLKPSNSSSSTLVPVVYLAAPKMVVAGWGLNAAGVWVEATDAVALYGSDISIWPSSLIFQVGASPLTISATVPNTVVRYNGAITTVPFLMPAGAYVFSRMGLNAFVRSL